MPLETAATIADLNPSNPASTDQLQQADDHLRLIKSALKATFPNVAGPIASSDTAIDAAVAANVAGTNKFADGTIPLPGAAFLADPDTGFSRPAANTVVTSVGGAEAIRTTPDLKTAFAGEVSSTKFSGGTGQLVPLGGGLIWFDDALPTEGGYAWANGQAISRTVYAALFAKWSTRFGVGDGTTTFNIPDLKERAPVGKSTMGGAANANRIPQYDLTALGNTPGEAKHTQTLAEAPAHDHGGVTGAPSVQHTHAPHAGQTHRTYNINPGSGVDLIEIGGAGPAFSDQTGVESVPHTHSITSAGGGTPFNIVQPGFVCNWIIRIA